MSRRAVLATVTGVVLLGAFGAPAIAGPLPEQRTQLCLRLDSESGEREGVCVWTPTAPR